MSAIQNAAAGTAAASFVASQIGNSIAGTFGMPNWLSVKLHGRRPSARLGRKWPMAQQPAVIMPM